MCSNHNCRLGYSNGPAGLPGAEPHGRLRGMANIRIIKIKPGLTETDAATEQYDVEKVQDYEDGAVFFQGKNSGRSFYLSPDLVKQIRELKFSNPKRPAPAKG